MNVEQEIRAQIEKNKGLKLAVGEINNHLSVLEGLLRNERDDAQKRVDEAYQRGVEDGRNETWEAARKIVLSPDEGGTSLPALFAIFGRGSMQQAFRKNSASEAIEKLKAYEAEQGHSDTIDESYTIGYKQANNNSKSNTECDGCLYDYGIKEHSLCHICSNAYINYWTAKKQDDKIEVGDEVETKDGKRFAVTTFLDGDIAVGVCADGLGRGVDLKELRKTGRHFDIEKILEEMRG